jgi:hypothetical protein
MFTKTRKDLVEHYAKMALNPATLDHARLRVKELEKDSTGLWTGIGKEIALRIKELKNL